MPMESEQINAIAIEWQVSTFGWAIRLHPDPKNWPTSCASPVKRGENEGFPQV